MSNPKLTILSEVLRGQTFELTKDTYTIGRSEDKDITIVDPTISGLHAILSRNDDGAYTVKDNGSTNGTRINGVIITEQRLSTSDILQVGGVEIMYEYAAETPTGANSTSSTIVIQPGESQINDNLKGLSTVGGKSKKGRESGATALAIKIIIGILGLVVLVLMALLGWRVMNPPS